MNPLIQYIKEKKLVGLKMLMSLADNKTAVLWRSFMSRRREIHNNISIDLISLQIYKEGYFREFKPSNEFEKWALAEVTDFESVPEGMETFILEGGLYAVFSYKGPANDPRIFQYIYNEWLPASGYELDFRPHFEILGEKYSNTDPHSEEEICIPVKLIQG